MPLDPNDVTTLDDLEAAAASQQLAYDKDDFDPDNQLSALEQIKADTSEDIAKPTYLRHPAKPAYVMAFRSNVSSDEAQRIEKRVKGSKQQVRDRNALFLAQTSVGIFLNGEEATNTDGKLMTFRDPDLMATLGVKTAAECAAKFLLYNDGHIIALADAVARAAGFGTEVEEVTDPTSLV